MQIHCTVRLNPIKDGTHHKHHSKNFQNQGQDHHHDHDDQHFCLLQYGMAEGHGLGLFMAIIFLSGEMAGVSKLLALLPRMAWFSFKRWLE